MLRVARIPLKILCYNLLCIMDPRNSALAKIFVEHSLKIKAHDNVVISTSDLYPIDLIRECYRQALQKDANVYLDIMGFNYLLDRSSYGDLVSTFYQYANDRQIKTPSAIYKAIADWGTKFVRITTFDNYKHLVAVDSSKTQAKMKALQPWFDSIIDKAWVLTYYPTPAMAQQADMSLMDLEAFYFSAVLTDYKNMEQGQKKLEKIIDKGKIVHVVGTKTDLTLSIEGRTAQMCVGEKNIPDGEIFTGPVEDKTEGHIYYEFPNDYSGKTMNGIYLEFKKGKVVKATSETNEDALKEVLATDPGALRLGEFAFGTNFGITRFMHQGLFDEKIGGTIHTALGRSYDDPKGWGKNKSAIHWDIIKDTRLKGSYVEIDGKKVLVDGKYVV